MDAACPRALGARAFERSVHRMDAAATIAQQLTVTHDRLRRAIDGLTEDDARQVLAGRLAPVVWQVGHLAYVDSNYVQRGGGSPPAPPHYADLFKPGTGGQRGLLSVARAADLAAPLDFPAYKSVGEMLVYSCFHRGYHIGKIATLRALLGKPLPR